MEQTRAPRRGRRPANPAAEPVAEPASTSPEESMRIPAQTTAEPAAEAGNPASVGARAGAHAAASGARQPQREGHHGHTEPGYIHSKDSQLKRLRRIEGQVRGLHRMVEQDTYCIDILTQISAATRALEAVALGLLDDHLKHCLTEAAADPGADMNAKLAEASAAIGRLVKA